MDKQSTILIAEAVTTQLKPMFPLVNFGTDCIGDLVFITINNRRLTFSRISSDGQNNVYGEIYKYNDPEYLEKTVKL